VRLTRFVSLGIAVVPPTDVLPDHPRKWKTTGGINATGTPTAPEGG